MSCCSCSRDHMRVWKRYHRTIYTIISPNLIADEFAVVALIDWQDLVVHYTYCVWSRRRCILSHHILLLTLSNFFFCCYHFCLTRLLLTQFILIALDVRVITWQTFGSSFILAAVIRHLWACKIMLQSLEPYSRLLGHVHWCRLKSFKSCELSLKRKLMFFKQYLILGDTVAWCSCGTQSVCLWKTMRISQELVLSLWL